MKLYMSGNSPYARRTRVVVRETGLSDRVEEVTIGSFDELTALGPGGKIPLLVTDAGNSLCESHIIINHLCDLSGISLLPTEPSALEQCRVLESTASVLMDSLFARSFESNQRAKETQSEFVLDREKARSNRCYDALESLVAQEEAIDLGTITAVCALGYADWRAPEDNWRNNRPNLSAFFEKAMQHDTFAATAPVF